VAYLTAYVTRDYIHTIIHNTTCRSYFALPRRFVRTHISIHISCIIFLTFLLVVTKVSGLDISKSILELKYKILITVFLL